MSTDISIDIETVGLKPGSIILSIGAVIFDRKGYEDDEPVKSIFYDKISYNLSVIDGFETCPDTYNWWQKQSSEAYREAWSGYKSPDHVLLQFRRFVIENRPKYTWCMGQDFDIPILKYGFHKYNIIWPLDFWDHRDIRTYCQAAKTDRYAVKQDLFKKSQITTAHHPVDDAIWGASCVRQAYADLRI